MSSFHSPLQRGENPSTASASTLDPVARRRLRSAIRDEVRRVAADENDREEMRIVREQLAGLAPPLTV
jgi:hypothetical protein